MRALWQATRQHPVVAAALAVGWLATWAVIWTTWTTGLEAWSIGVRFLFLLVPPAVVAAAQLRRGESRIVTREVFAAAGVVAAFDIVALFLPDLVIGIAQGDPWWGFVEAAVFVLVFAVAWAVAAIVAGAIGGAIGWWAASHVGRLPQPRPSTGR
jgi:hypothetical protein